MKTFVLALAAAATLGLAAPAFAQDGAPRGAPAAQTDGRSGAQDFSSRHRHYGHHRHYRHYGWNRGHHYGWRHHRGWRHHYGWHPRHRWHHRNRW